MAIRITTTIPSLSQAAKHRPPRASLLGVESLSSLHPPHSISCNQKMLRAVLLSALIYSASAFSLSPSLAGSTFAGRFNAKSSVSPLGLRTSARNSRAT
eukprot:774760-Rhodomonas_salina.3